MKNTVTVASMAKITPIIEEIIENGSDVCITVTGFSMYPMLRSCIDSVVLTKTDFRKIKKYSIPLYKRESGQYVLHRIIAIKNEELFLNGDNQTFVENAIFKHQIIAIVKGFYRGGRYFSCDNIIYKIYAWIWVTGLPIRKYMMFAFLRLAKLISKLRGKT